MDEGIAGEVVVHKGAADMDKGPEAGHLGRQLQQLLGAEVVAPAKNTYLCNQNCGR